MRLQAMRTAARQHRDQLFGADSRHAPVLARLPTDWCLGITRGRLSRRGPVDASGRKRGPGMALRSHFGRSFR